MPNAASQRGTIAAVLPEDARDSGVYQTSPGLLRRVALAQWAEGLSQYLAIRLGDVQRGRRAFAALTRMVRNLPPDELLVPPGPKAQLYRMARSIAEVDRAMPGGPGRRAGELPWRAPGGPGAQLFLRLRKELAETDGELLELRHARELSVAELACVLELAEDEVELRLDTAEARARKALGSRAPDPLSARASVFVEAFALARSWQSQAEASASLSMEEGREGLVPGTLVGGRYEVVERVGKGAFGDVYRARDVEVAGHRVALKLLRQPSLSESSRQSALRELKLNAAVFHPSLVQFKDHGWFEQRLWFVMPWYEGETLEARMRREPLSRSEARRIFEPLARALAAMHEAGIRHQDIKPDNIFLAQLPGQGEGDDLLPVLIDLGVAAEEQETMLGGTPLYFAPEVARRFVGRGPIGPAVDRSADVFALALSLRNALEPDTQDDVPAGAIQAFVERRAEEMPPLPVSPELRYLTPTLERWLSLDPLERPSAAELAEELGVLTAPEERRARRLRLVRWLAPLLATLAALFSLALYAVERRAAHEEAEAARARREAAGVRADLVEENARRTALEAGHAELLARYEQGRLTRHELAAQLATIDQRLSSTQDTLTQSEAGRAALRLERDGALARIAALDASLTRTGEELVGQRARAEGLDRELAQARARLADAETEHARLANERDGAQRELAVASRELEASRQAEVRGRAAREALGRALTEAQDAEAATGAELARVRARVDALAASIAGPSDEEATPPASQP